MKRHKIKGIIIMLVVIMLSGAVPISTNATELESAKQEQADLEQKKKSIDSKIASLAKEKGDIVNYIEKLDAELNQLTKEIYELSEKIEVAEADLEVTRQELEEAKVREREQYECMNKRIQYIYENGEPSFVEILIESKDISEFLNQVEIRSKITEYDNNILDDYIKITEEVYQKEKELETNVASLNIMNEELEYEQDAVVILVEEKSKELTVHEDEIAAAEIVSMNYSAELEEQAAKIEHLEEEERKKAEEELKRKQEEERKRREAEELAKIAKRREEEEARQKQEESRRQKAEKATEKTTDKTTEKATEKATEKNTEKTTEKTTEKATESSNQSSGAFAWPVPSSRRVTSEFNPNRLHPVYGYYRPHRGMDIGAPNGSNIVAAESGTVTSTGYDSSAGNFVVINHGNGFTTRYYHCSRIIVSTGQSVSRGQVIAYVGSTGSSTGPHLHFEIRINGTAVNPRSYLN